jgi:hypothetical protein
LNFLWILVDAAQLFKLYDNISSCFSQLGKLCYNIPVTQLSKLCNNNTTLLFTAWKAVLQESCVTRKKPLHGEAAFILF